jgi:hypothetical protein
MGNILQIIVGILSLLQVALASAVAAGATAPKWMVIAGAVLAAVAGSLRAGLFGPLPDKPADPPAGPTVKP